MAQISGSFAGPLIQNLATFDARAKLGIEAILQLHAPRIEGEMRRRAPWNDQTGNARNGLTARAQGGGLGRARNAQGQFQGGGGYSIVLSHGVPYGIWLEVRFSGRYAIIDPTIQREGPAVMASATRLLDVMAGGTP